MTDETIVAEGVGKLYRIGAKPLGRKRRDLASLVGSALMAPIRNFQQLRALDTFRAHAQGHRESELEAWALRDVSFTIKRGETVGIIGRNGAGKSTLLKVFSRVTEPTTGRVRMRGRLSSLLEVGTGFHPELTGRENVYLNGTILGMTKREIDRKFDEIVEFAGVSKFLDTPVKRYSSGMKVRLGFAVAAHLEPDILIVDEVLAVGDYEFQRKCIGKMRDVATGQGRTVLFVSHSMSAVSNLCQRGIMLEKGRVTMDAPVGDVIQTYLRSGGNSESVQTEFDLDPSKPAQFVSVEILDRDGHLKYEHSCDEPVTIRLAVEIRERTPDLSLNVLVLNMEGAKVLFSDVRDAAPDIGSSLGPGRHEFEVVIPGRLLAPGSYVLNLACLSKAKSHRKSKGTIESHLSCCGFQLTDLSSHLEKRPGVLSVLLPWQHAIG